MEKTSAKNSAHEAVLPYDPAWPEKFADEAAKIKEIFGDRIVAVEHIGSTSVPGLEAKPIIDLAVLVPSWRDADALVDPLATLGYPFDRAAHDATGGERHLFRKGNPTEFHLSIAYGDRGSFLERQILFRDYLRAHDEARDDYGRLKRDLLAADPTGQGSYVGGKTDFVMRVLKKAGFQNPWFDLSRY